MVPGDILRQLSDGAILEGPHWTEPVRVLTARGRGAKVEVQAVGLRTKRLWTKLLKPEEFDGTIRVSQPHRLVAARVARQIQRELYCYQPRYGQRHLRTQRLGRQSAVRYLCRLCGPPGRHPQPIAGRALGFGDRG